MLFSISSITVDLPDISPIHCSKLKSTSAREMRYAHMSMVFPAPAAKNIQHRFLTLGSKDLRMPLIQSFDLSSDSQLLNSAPSVNHTPVPACLSRMFDFCNFRASTSPKVLNIFCRSSPRGDSSVDTLSRRGGQNQLITNFSLSARSASSLSLIPSSAPRISSKVVLSQRKQPIRKALR
jgi:hypothetical protein